jgi:hypothetical protein
MPPQRDATTDILVAELRQTIVDLRADRDHWRADSDHWRAAFENTQRLLPGAGATTRNHRSCRQQPRAGMALDAQERLRWCAARAARSVEETEVG